MMNLFYRSVNIEREGILLKRQFFLVSSSFLNILNSARKRSAELISLEKSSG